MTTKVKAYGFSFLIFAIVFVITRIVLVTGFHMEPSLIVSIISAVVASLLSPRQVISKKQSGTDVQLKWLFSKRLITFK